MSVVRNLLVRIGADFSGMRREMQRAQQNLQQFSQNVNKTMSGIAASLATIGIGAAIKEAADDAMKVEAAMQQINRMMGSSAAEFADWAKHSAAAFNMSRSEAIRFGATYSNLVATFSTDTTKTFDYTTQLLKASSVIAAATGRDMGDVMERIRSGMLGNTEAIEDLGVNVQVSMLESTDAFKKFANGKSWDQLDFRVKQQIIMFGILEQTTKKYGESLADNTASRLAAFTTQLKNARLSLGQAFLPIINVILPSLTAFASALARVMSLVAQFSQALFGKGIVSSAKATDAQAGAVGGLGDAYDEAGKKAKKAANSLAGFDEVNTLGSGSKDDDDDGAAGMGANIDSGIGGGIGEATDEVSSKVQEMATKVRAAFGELSAFIVQHKEIIIAAVGGIALAFGTLAAVNGVNLLLQGIGSAIGLILSPIGLLVLGIAALAGAFIYLWRNNEDFRTNVIALWEDIKKRLVIAWNWISEQAAIIWNGLKQFWATNGENIKSGLITVWEGIKTVLETTWNVISGIATAVWGSLKTFWSGHGDEVKEALTQVWEVIKSALGATWATISGVATSVFGALATFFTTHTKEIENLLTSVWETIWQVIEPIWTIMSDLAVEIFDGLKEFWKEWGPEVQGFLTNAFELAWVVIEKVWNTIDSVARSIFGALEKFWDEWGGTLTKLFSNTWDIVLDTLGTAFKIIGEIFGIFADALQGNWSGVWDHIKNIGKAAWEWLVKTIGNLANSFVIIFEKMGDVLYDIWIDIWNYVKGIVNDIIGMVNRMIDAVNRVGSKIGIEIKNIPELKMSLNTDGLRQKQQSDALIAQKTAEAANMFAVNAAKIEGALSSGQINAEAAAQQRSQLESLKQLMDARINDYKVSINLPKMPELARGGIVDGETNMGNYIAGEAGAEMIVPLENTSFVDKLASALGTAVMSAMQFNNSNGGGSNRQGDTNLIIDGTTIARVIAPYLDKESNRIGGAMITST